MATNAVALPTTQYDTEIRAMLRSGWMSANVVKHLLLIHNATVPIQTVEAIKATLDPEEMLPLSTLQQRYSNLDLVTDAQGEMERLLRLQSERLGTALTLETAGKARLPYVDKAVRSYWTMLVEFVAVQQSLGSLPSVKNASKLPQLPTMPQDTPTLRGIMSMVFEATAPPSTRMTPSDGDTIDATYSRRSEADPGGDTP